MGENIGKELLRIFRYKYEAFFWDSSIFGFGRGEGVNVCSNTTITDGREYFFFSIFHVG